MTLQCPNCECFDVEIFDDNGARYPQTRIEWYECNGCGHEFRKVLTV